MKYVNKVFKLLRNKVLNRGGVTISDNGSNNKVLISQPFYSDNLKIIIYGNNNVVKILRSCVLKKTNVIFIQGNNNEVKIGENVTFDQDVSIVVAEGTKVNIGSDCIFAKGVRIRTSDQHAIYDAENNRINRAKDVTIGEHVWLGQFSTIMKGISVNNGSIVGLGSIVTKDVPPNSIATGVPAKVVKTNVYWREKM